METNPHRRSNREDELEPKPAESRRAEGEDKSEIDDSDKGNDLDKPNQEDVECARR